MRLTADPAFPRRTADAEALAGLIRASSESGVARHAALLRLHRLPPALARAHHLRLFRAAAEPLLGAGRARGFNLPGGSLAVVWRGDAEAALEEAGRRIGLLLADAPAGGTEAGPLLACFDLPRDAAALRAAVAEIEAAAPPRETHGSDGAPLDLAALARLEDTLAPAHAAGLARRRPVWRIEAGGATLAWEKRFLSAPDIAASLAPGYGLRADPWLFRRLTRRLDRLMLGLLSRPEELRGAAPFGLHLNVSSLLSPEFLRFDAALPASLRGQVVLGVTLPDILADPEAFAFARDFARMRGHRLMLRGITATLLPVAAGGRMEVDHVQLRWSPALAEAAAGMLAPLAAGPDSLVLARADAPEAVDWGRARGIRLFQGAAARG